MINKLAALGTSLVVVAAIAVTILLRDQSQQTQSPSPLHLDGPAPEGSSASDPPKTRDSVRLSSSQQTQSGIETATAGPGRAALRNHRAV